jgi:hypothetical protein
MPAFSLEAARSPSSWSHRVRIAGRRGFRGIEYTVLIPGEPAQATELLPQAVNLDCFPTSFILGRDGRVKMIHAGFPCPGSGEFYDEAAREISGTVERLLAWNTSPAGVSTAATPTRRPQLKLTPAVASPQVGSSPVRLSLTVMSPHLRRRGRTTLRP